ncbi:ankyrin, partial [Canariomyces notabilis]
DVQDHYGRTPLLLAAAAGHDAVVRGLINAGADLNHKDSVYGMTALHTAAAHGHAEVVKMLLRHGADVHHGDSSPVGETPLSCAAAKGHIPVASLLLQAGAKVDSWDRIGWTPLHHAVKHGRRKTVEVLLR